ncbi:MAG: DUF5107 domain-containing protein [Micromonosporaceae bacterium]
MTELRIETRHLPVADLGPLNPLPPLGRPPAPFDLDTTGLPSDMAERIGYGQPPHLMPYLDQDGYTRDRRPGELRTAVLDNGVLRAEFALERGGRLWSLRHRGRELLSANRVFQPANLALRNAWFSGGAEWNIGTRGHSPTTCDPLHAARVDRPGGTPMLRMWQWERLRSVVFAIDAWLDGELLLVHVSIRNPNADTVPMYWWSNIAVPQTAGVRVLVPATTAYRTSYDGRLAEVPVPGEGAESRAHASRESAPSGPDYATWPARSPYAADYFFRVPDGARPWIAALDADGTGLFQTSTGLLRGRKLFVWGRSKGGRHWQDWLSGGSESSGGPGGSEGSGGFGEEYLEIQAGLAATQYEHVPMPAGARWSWVEAYGLASVDPAVSHGADWGAATAATGQAIRSVASDGVLDAALRTATALADQPPAEPLQAGDGWGALERRRRALTGEPAPDTPGTPFGDATLTGEQRPFLALLDTGTLPGADPTTPPPGYVVGADWRRRLEASAPSWISRLHLGVAAHAAGDTGAARVAYTESLAHARTPWALRNLALLETGEARADLLWQAHRLAPGLWQLAVEAGEALLAADRPADVLRLLDEAPPAVRDHGRCRLLAARAGLAAGDLDRAGELLESGIEVADLREGEIALDALWREYRAHRIAADAGVPLGDSHRAAAHAEPVPERYDFRMFGDEAG